MQFFLLIVGNGLFTYKTFIALFSMQTWAWTAVKWSTGVFTERNDGMELVESIDFKLMTVKLFLVSVRLSFCPRPNHFPLPRSSHEFVGLLV